MPGHEEGEENYVTVRLPKDLAHEMDRLIGTHGYRTRAEIAKEAIRKFLFRHQFIKRISNRNEKREKSL